MKKTLFGLLLGMSVMGLLAMQSIYNPKANTAEVDQEQGMYIFIRSKPVNDYKFLGKIKMSFITSSKPSENLASALKRAAKQFPEANGVIVQSDNYESVDAIQITE